MDLFTIEQLLAFLGETAHNQLLRDAAIFALAAFIHSGRVKKEIRQQLGGLTEAFRDEAKSLRMIVELNTKDIDMLKQDVKQLRFNKPQGE